MRKSTSANSETIRFRCTKDEARMFRRMAKLDKRTLSGWLRVLAWREYMQNREMEK